MEQDPGSKIIYLNIVIVIRWLGFSFSSSGFTSLGSYTWYWWTDGWKFTCWGCCWIHWLPFGVCGLGADWKTGTCPIPCCWKGGMWCTACGWKGGTGLAAADQLGCIQPTGTISSFFSDLVPSKLWYFFSLSIIFWNKKWSSSVIFWLLFTFGDCSPDNILFLPSDPSSPSGCL